MKMNIGSGKYKTGFTDIYYNPCFSHFDQLFTQNFQFQNNIRENSAPLFRQFFHSFLISKAANRTLMMTLSFNFHLNVLYEFEKVQTKFSTEAKMSCTLQTQARKLPKASLKPGKKTKTRKRPRISKTFPMCRNRKCGFRFYDVWQQVLDSPPQTIENFLILVTSKAAKSHQK